MNLPPMPPQIEPVTPEPFKPLIDIGNLIEIGVKAFAFGAGVKHGHKISVALCRPGPRCRPNDRGRARRFNR